MSTDFLTPDTNMALLKAAQNQADKVKGNLNSTKTNKEQAITEAAQEFEAVFLAEMLKPMFEGTEAEAPFNGGQGEKVFQSFLLQEYGKILAQTGNIGIADHVRTELINIQEKTSNESP